MAIQSLHWLKKKVLKHFNATDETKIKYKFNNSKEEDESDAETYKIIYTQTDWVACFRDYKNSKSLREATRFRQSFNGYLNVLDVKNINVDIRKKIQTLKNIQLLIESGEGDKIFPNSNNLIDRLVSIIMETNMVEEHQDIFLNTFLTLNTFIKYLVASSTSNKRIGTNEGNNDHVNKIIDIFEEKDKSIQVMCTIAYNILTDVHNIFGNSVKSTICNLIIEIIAIFSHSAKKSNSKIYQTLSKPFVIRLLIYIFENFSRHTFEALHLICQFLDPTKEPYSILELAKHKYVHKLISLASDYHTQVKRQALRMLSMLHIYIYILYICRLL